MNWGNVGNTKRIFRTTQWKTVIKGGTYARFGIYGIQKRDVQGQITIFTSETATEVLKSKKRTKKVHGGYSCTTIQRHL